MSKPLHARSLWGCDEEKRHAKNLAAFGADVTSRQPPVASLCRLNPEQSVQAVGHEIGQEIALDASVSWKSARELLPFASTPWVATLDSGAFACLDSSMGEFCIGVYTSIHARECGLHLVLMLPEFAFLEVKKPFS